MSLLESIKAEGYDELAKFGGGQAIVFKVRHNEHGYVRALRLYNAPIVSINPEKEKVFLDFKNECKLLLRLGNGGHPNVIRTGSPMMIGGHPGYEMDFLDGQDVEAYLKKEKCFDIPPVIRFLTEMSSALAYCHYDVYKYSINPNEDSMFITKDDYGPWEAKTGAEKQLVDKYKVIHNDIHTKNIFVRNDGRFILLDFGLAFEATKGLRGSLKVQGVLEYKAPERFDSSDDPNEQTDIYSFGITLFECLTGSLPFFVLNNNKQKNEAEINQLREAHKNSPIPDLWDIRKAALKSKGIVRNEKDYPDWLEAVIRKCLAKDPADRYQNGKELHLAVTKALERQARFEHKILIDKELATSKAQQIEEHERSKQSYRKQITKLETELDELQNQKTKATNDTTEKYQTQITTLEIKIEDLNKRLDRKTNDFTNANNLLTASEQINQGLTTKAQTFENQIATLNQTIANLKNRPATEKIVEKIVTVTVLPEAAKKEIAKVKSRTLGQLVGIGAIAALLGGGIGWNMGKPKEVAEEVAVDSVYVAVDSTAAPVDSKAWPTLAACEDVLKYYEVQENLGGQKKPLEQNTIDQILLIVKAYPQLKERAYQIYYNEGMRLKPIDEPSSRPYFKVAKEIEAL